MTYYRTYTKYVFHFLCDIPQRTCKEKNEYYSAIIVLLIIVEQSYPYFGMADVGNDINSVCYYSIDKKYTDSMSLWIGENEFGEDPDFKDFDKLDELSELDEIYNRNSIDTTSHESDEIVSHDEFLSDNSLSDDEFSLNNGYDSELEEAYKKYKYLIQTNPVSPIDNVLSENDPNGFIHFANSCYATTSLLNP
jgi:hypothetical protein